MSGRLQLRAGPRGRPEEPAVARADRHGKTGLREVWARAVFAGYLSVAYLVLVFGPLSEDSYFLLDDWQTLADVYAPSDVLYQHNGHWYLGPLLIVKVLYAVFGITTFTPYLMVGVGIHIGIVALLRVVMRRAGVGSWTSTAAAASVAVFSATELNLFWLSYGYSFGAAVLSGLAYVLVATAPGRPAAWRDATAVAFGVLSLIFGNVAVALMVSTAVALALRSGWRRAVTMVAIPAMVWLLYEVFVADGSEPTPALWSLPGWVGEEMVLAVQSLAGWRVAAVPLGFGIVAGLLLLVRRVGLDGALRGRSEAVGLAAGGLAFSIGTWFTRGVQWEPSVVRYVTTIALLLLPLVAVALYELITRNRWAVVLLVPMLVTGPVHAADLRSEGMARVADGSRVFLPASAQWPTAESLPGWVLPDRGYAGKANPITLGWLRQAQADGRLPESLPIEGAVEDELRIRLGVQPIDPSLIAETGKCRDLNPGESIDLHVGRGDALLVRTGPAGGAVAVRHREPSMSGQVWSGSGPNLRFALGFLLPDLAVSVSPAPLEELGPGEPEAVRVCTGMFSVPR